MDIIGCDTGLKKQDYYGHLRAFAVMLITEDENCFARAYAYATDYSKPNRKTGLHVWKMIKCGTSYSNKQYQKYMEDHA